MNEEFPHDGGDCPTAYCGTPNTMVPHNNRPQGSIAPIAMEQLRTYQERAASWKMYRVRRDGRDMSCCQACDQSLWFVSDREEQPYHYTAEQIMTLLVAHIRQAHDPSGDNNGHRQD